MERPRSSRHLTSPPLETSPVLVRRDALPVTFGMEVDGLWRNAGAVYSLRGVPALDAVIPPMWSVSWNTLPELKPLLPHLHPIESHIAIVQQRARLTGQQQALIEPGFVVRVPPWHLHGFECGDNKPFWAITWQQAEHSLFCTDDSTTCERLVYFEDSAEAQEQQDKSAAVEVQDRCCNRVNSPLTIRAERGSPTFYYVDFTTMDSIQLCTQGPTLVFGAAETVAVTLNGQVQSLGEGDTFATAGICGDDEFVITRQSPESRIGILVFPTPVRPL